MVLCSREIAPEPLLSRRNEVHIVSAELILAAISAGAALVSTVVSIVALYKTGKTEGRSLEMFRRQGVIDLHMAWAGVNSLNATALIGPDVQRAANALSLTASLWNHDIVDKVILYQSYWEAFRDLHDFLKTNANLQVPGYAKTCRDFLSPEVEKVYEEMRHRTLSGVTQTRIA